MVGGEKAARATGSAKNLIEDQIDAVAAANLPHPAKIARGRYDAAGGDSANRLEHEGQYVFRAEVAYLLFKSVGALVRKALHRVALRHAVGDRRRHFRRSHGETVQKGSQPLISGHAEGRNGPAVIGGLATDYLPALGGAGRDDILAQELD